uniref:non-specific serine/threonine protein kinase n=1 Tax=Kalanchoe fedtschenkoi TaxID=63787 RepID=A0A7N0VE57_KALFE
SSRLGSSSYDKFDKCAPARCGDTDVRYPFYLQGLQPSYCGEPGYNVSCIINGYFPMLSLRVKSSAFFIRFVHYRDKVLPVLTQAFFTVEETCTVPEAEMQTLANNPHFVPGKNSKWVALYTGCVKPLPSNLTSYSSSKCSDPILLMLEGDPYSKYASGVCRRAVRMPMKVNDGELTLTREELARRRAGATWLEYKTVLQRGIYLSWTAPSLQTCTSSGGRWGYQDGNHSLRCFCRDGAYASSCPRSIRNMVISIVSGVSVAGLAVMVIVILLRIRKKRRENPNSITEFLKKNESLTPKRYKYWEIKKMTRSFKDKLGQGGFGTVYKGELKDGRPVAVKVLSSGNSGNGEDFINEVASFSRTSHVNIVSLIGFCIEGSKRALIYQFMANGSLEKFIYEEKLSGAKRILGWDKLHSIAVGIAQGLEYLHRGCNTRILHFDIKPHNILLDEDFCPKISDFGLAKVCVRQESAVSMLGARGTIGYIAPEQVCINFGQVSHKSDVYSYGMMI